MAKSHPLVVIYSPDARDELGEIWKHNFERYTFEHAVGYEGFLMAGISALSDSYDEGRFVDGFPNLRRITLKRSRGGDGHIVIYEIDEVNRQVNILHIFHTKMDVKGRLEQDLH